MTSRCLSSYLYQRVCDVEHLLFFFNKVTLFVIIVIAIMFFLLFQTLFIRVQKFSVWCAKHIITASTY